MASRVNSQNQQILKYLKKNRNGITPMDALKLCGCFRLSARIHDLKEEGHNIYKTMEYVETEEGTRKGYARYFLHS
jgi:hypothetical protein